MIGAGSALVTGTGPCESDESVDGCSVLAKDDGVGSARLLGGGNESVVAAYGKSGEGEGWFGGCCVLFSNSQGRGGGI
jgi:hypothetical protein